MEYLVNIVRFIKGYVIFTAEKGFLERFINLSGKHRIYLWDISIDDNKLTASASLKSFRKIRAIARKSGVRLSVEEKIGLIFKYRKYNKRIGTAIGLIIFFSFHIIMNQFVWCIDVNGNQEISAEEILNSAEETGLRHGALKKGYNEIRASREIASQFNGKIPWMSINIKGSMAIIELREDNNPIKETESEEGCNIIADFDGIILSTETFRGDLQVNTGNAVKKGDLLISGIIENEDFSSNYYKAKGNLTAIRSKSFTEEEKPTSFNRIKIKNTFYTIGFLGKEFGHRKKADKKSALKDKASLEINGYVLPFYICKYTEFTTLSEDSYSDNGDIYCYESFNDKKKQFNKKSTVLSEKETIKIKNNVFTFDAEYKTIDFIGKEEKILSAK